MQITEMEGKGRVLQSQLFIPLEGITHYSSLKETHQAEEMIWMPKQIHGAVIVRREDYESSEFPEADAVICNTPGQWIGVRTADCVPVLIYDPVCQVVAAIHAGWRGTVIHIVQKVIRRLKQDYGCLGPNLYAMVGPSISPEAFEVGDEVVEAFVKAGRGDCVLPASNSVLKPHIDLWQSNVMDMLEEDLDLEHIDCTPLCTLQNSDILYSARKEGIQTGRIVTAIRLK